MLRTSPVLLLADRPDDAAIDRLLREWNPSAVLPEVAEGVRWAGPFQLDAAGRAEAAGLPPSSGWTTAYAARAPRSRTRVPDGLDANLLRLRYPHGVPTGAEAVAWSLIMGLARRLDGVGRLPAASPRRGSHGNRGSRGSRGSRTLAVQRALAQENVYCVYGNEPLPWSALRSELCLSLPGLDRSGALGNESTADEHCYCLDSPGAFEVRVQPFRPDPNGFVPYALRPGTTSDWPGTLYRFRCLPQQTEQAAQRIDAQLRAAACLLADIVGGTLLDGDGFPLLGTASAMRR
ncbi:MAG TPA: hypothetical protein VH372_03105 [Actinospica sp.]|nr:hypothetical protein [Actinospica sp.]